MSQQPIVNPIPDALKNFSLYPDCAHVRLSTVKGLFGISAATVWRMVKANKLKSHKLTPRTTTFNVGELRQVLAAAKS
ncbi:MAG: transcriptional regulator [Methylotenera sp.]|uniref:helix-turn-helix transcriptional regulator n=1 Tax=Methylotenera sp. TaxID=2051956 RepID=UPI0017C57F17|nr:transcriptional regulator [Methylotenera sp.]NOU24084.1 transcriptional regulator [Methylotenera sp.]